MFTLGLRIALAFLPAAGIAWLARRATSLPGYPAPKAGKSLVYGIVAAFLAAFAGILLQEWTGGALERNVVSKAFFVAGFVEEVAKYLFARRYILDSPSFVGASDTMYRTVCVGLGFSIGENFFYLDSGSMVLAARAFTSVPMHAIAAAFSGYAAGKAKFNESGDWILGLAAATAFHGLYDFLLFLGSPWAWGIVPLLATGTALALSTARKAVKADLESGRCGSPASRPRGERGTSFFE